MNNVVQVALYYGVLKKYNKVWLIGNEYDFWKSVTVSTDGNPYITYEHAFETNDLLEKWYLSEDEQCIAHGKSLVSGLLCRISETLDGYFDIAEYAQKNDTVIYNLSEGTVIDAFPIRKYESVKGD